MAAQNFDIDLIFLENAIRRRNYSKDTSILIIEKLIFKSFFLNQVYAALKISFAISDPADGGFEALVKFSDPVIINGNASMGRFGHTITSLGDVNNDGYQGKLVSFSESILWKD